MALQTSGQISLNDIHVEAGGSSGTQAALNDSDIRGLIDKSSGAQMSFSEWYGASAETVLTSGGTVNGQAQRQEITVSSFISSGGTLRIPSNIWVWSDSISTAALTVDIPCTIINEGKIIGKGGAGGGDYTTVQNGGRAIYITSSGVTITNSSGAYIAGGGGGGQGAPNRSSGGGGAGGAQGGDTPNGLGGTGGALNASGIDGQNGYAGVGEGGGAGGGGGSVFRSGGGGGRILPGTGGAGGLDSSMNQGWHGGDGGSAGNTGSAGTNAGGGGGGWGARGGFVSTNSNPYGTGGAAIGKTTSYTLSNSGTIYGAT